MTTLRAAAPEDEAEVLRLLQETELEAAFVPGEFIVAREGGRLAGCARLKPLPDGSHEIASVAVAPGLRGTGLGTRLVEAILERTTGPVWALALAPGFFARFGFAPAAALPDELRAKAEGACASRGFAPMLRASHAEQVQARYGHIARTRASGSSNPYSPDELALLPRGVQLGLGSGHPVRAAALREGETVVDLGSGAGVDVFLAARLVGSRGRAIGVDFTPEMVERAVRSARESGAANVDFHLAPIEKLPLQEASADVVISNCVVNLSTDKPATLREAHRVLRPGGRLVVSDILRIQGDASSPAPSCDCTSGALSPAEWERLLAEAGFEGGRVEVSPPGGCCEGPTTSRGIVCALKPVAS